MKKVVILHTAHWQQAIGGAELQIKFLIENLISKNFKVFFIYEDNKIPFVSEFNELNLLPIKHIIKSKRLGDPWILHKRDIFKHLHIIKPDAIYTRTYSSWSGCATKYAIKNNIAHVWAVASDNDIPDAFKNTSVLKPFDKVAKSLMNFTLKNCTQIIIQNSKQQTDLLNLFGRKGVLVTQASKIVKNVKLIDKSSSKLEVIWIANLKPIKQPKVFLKLVKNFKNDSRICFTMVGKPSKKYDNVIRELDSASNFKFLGQLDNNKVNDLLLKSHVLVNTSLSEGFSNTFVQAWLRKVVVISMNSNPNNILTDKKIGFVEASIPKISSRLNFLIEEKKYLKFTAEKAYDYAINHHNIDKELNKVVELLK